MPAKSVEINLLGENELEHTPIGRIVAWATTYGRYIMIGTEIIVLLAFISRFSLDRRLTDLNEEIAEKQTIIESNQDLELNIRTLQQQLKNIKTIMTGQQKPLELISLIQTILPPDVYLDSLEINKREIKLTAVAGTTSGFSQFISLLSTNPKFQHVELGEVKKNPERGIQFQANAIIK